METEDVERERMEIEKDKQDRACNWRLIHGKAVKATFGYSTVEVDRSTERARVQLFLREGGMTKVKGGEGIFETHIFLL